MENNDLGSKKMNNAQKVNEGFSGDNLPDDYNDENSKLKAEIETDESGNQKVVKRARNVEQEKLTSSDNSDTPGSKPSTAPEDDGKKMVENKDRNSDITKNRYPNSEPDNHKNRGNINTEE